MQSKFGGPDRVLEYRTNVSHPKPGPEDVLVRIKAVGINPVDIAIQSESFIQPPLPFIPGIDFAGIVEEIGSNVTSVKVGQ